MWHMLALRIFAQHIIQVPRTHERRHARVYSLNLQRRNVKNVRGKQVRNATGRIFYTLIMHQSSPVTQSLFGKTKSLTQHLYHKYCIMSCIMSWYFSYNHFLSNNGCLLWLSFWCIWNSWAVPFRRRIDALHQIPFTAVWLFAEARRKHYA